MHRKIFKYCIILIVCTFTILGIMTYGFMGTYFKDTVLERMETSVDEVVNIMEENAGNTLSSFSRIVDYYSASSNSYIIVFDEKGNVKLASTTVSNYLYGHQLPEDITGKILSGEAVSGIEKFANIFGTHVIIFGKPLVHNEKISGGVLSVIPQPQLGELKWGMFRYFIVGIVVSLIFAAVMAYLISIQVTKPIRKINEALKKIATGEFKSDLNLGGDLKLLSDTFNKMASAIKNSDRVGKEFLANVSHELRTPMTTITGFLQGIEDGTIPQEKHKEYINLVINEMKRMTRLVNGLLEVARMDYAKEEFTTEHFDINELLRVSLLKAENSIMEKNLSVKIEFGREKLLVDANCDGITRVVTNLIDNAVKFVNEGGYICLKTKASGDSAVISIENSGMGISKDDIEFIFDRFHKSDKSRSMDKKGVGLGLYIVKNIMSQHGRKITVESEEGKFTRFTFSLKRVR